MPSEYLVRNLTAEQAEKNIQISVAINPKELLLTNPNHKNIISVLKGLSRYPFNVTIQTIQDENELESYYFKDKRNPEIMITIADNTQALDYKNILLLLWVELQMMKIDLLFYVYPEWRAIPGPNGFPSLFSLLNPHKSKHPILEIKFDIEEIESMGIEYDYEKYRVNFFTNMINQIDAARRQVQSEKTLYRSILYDEDNFRKYFSDKIKVYQTILSNLRENSGNDKNQEENYFELVAQYQKLFADECRKDKKMQQFIHCFIHHYPKNADGTFDSRVAQLMNFCQFTESEVLFIPKKIQETFETKLAELKQEFHQFLDNLDFKTEKNSTYIHFVRVCQTIKLDVLMLIEKNPSKMRTILAQLKYVYQEYLVSQFQVLTISLNENKKMKNSYFYTGASYVPFIFNNVIRPIVSAPVKQILFKP